MRSLKSKKHRKIIFLAIFCFLNFIFVSAQTGKQITGRVSDAKGELLIGVTVAEVGTTNGVSTDLNGTYSLKLTSEESALKFTYVGYKEKVVEVGKRAVIDVALDESVELLEELVVVGYGHQRKASVVGAITAVNPEALLSAPARSVSNNIAGKLAGVIAVQRSGNPGFNDSDFWIRGIGTLASGYSKPLVLIDGVERSLHDMDPNEIESFSVLKDAAASAVYGVRGANGVIMITTKRGKIGAPKVSARVERAYIQPIKIPEYIGSSQYLELLNEIHQDANPNKPALYDMATIENYRYQTDPELYPDINWWNVIAKDYANGTTANLDVNGGSDILRYALTLGLYDERGIIERDKSKEWDSSLKVRRYNVRSNMDINLTKSTLFRFNLGGHLLVRNSPPGLDNESDVGLFYQASRIPPYVHPPVYSTGEIPRVYARENPWAWATQRGYKSLNRSKIESLASVEQDLKFVTPGLAAKLMFSFDRFSGASVTRAKDPDYYYPARSRKPDGTLDLAILSNGQQFLGYDKGAEWGELSTYLEANLSYDRVFKGKHAINSMLLYNQRELQRGTESWDRLPYRMQGLSGRFSYTYDTRYIAEFNFGYNGSENFAKGNRYGFFPSTSLGWIISQENFMQGIEAISNLKLRGSWGKVGNSILGRDIWSERFSYISTIEDYGWYTFGTESGFYRAGKAEGQIANEKLTWEISTKTNLGLEVGLWDNSINFTADVFADKRRNIFIPQSNLIPGSVGFIKTSYANSGAVDNKGFEMSLNINRKLSDDWYLSVMTNYTFARNKIVKTDEAAGKVGTSRAETGHPVGQIFGLVADGLFTEGDFDASGNLNPGIPAHSFGAVRPGDIKYADLTGDDIVDVMDRTAIGGTFNPEIVYGFGANLRYKNLDFGFFFQGVGNAYQMLGGENWLPGTAQGATGNIFTNVDSRWTKLNPSQDVFWPRLTYGPNDNNEQASTWWLKDMSFVRLKTMEFGYALPKDWFKMAGVEHLRFFVRGSNLLTFSKFKLWDPELATTDGLKYPMTQSLSFGLSVNFQ